MTKEKQQHFELPNGEKWTCERCGEELTTATIVWLELDWSTNIFSKEKVEEKYSQGSFPFGSGCAATVLKAGGKLTRIRNAKR